MIINMNGAKAPETPSSVLQEKTVTPETLPTVIGPDEGYDGLTQVTVNPDAQLKAENIRSGKTVFGVQGAFVGEPTAGIDMSKVGPGQSFTMHYGGMIADPVNWITDSERLTELPFTSRWVYSDYSAIYISYDKGCVATTKNNSLTTTSSSYVPSVSNYMWYHHSGTISSGNKEFYLPNNLNDFVSNPSHISGTAWLAPVLVITSGDLSLLSISSLSTDTTFASKQNDPILISIDAPLIETDATTIYQSKYKFVLDVPEITCDMYGYVYQSNPYKGLAITYMVVPQRILIS